VYPLHRWQAVANLTPEERHALTTLGDVGVQYRAGTTIRREGTKVSGFYLHLNGWIASSILLQSGARFIQKVHLPGDVLGATSMVLTHAADTLTAITRADVSFVPFERLRPLYTRLPRLGALITFAAQAERLALIDALVVKGRASAKEQLARLFLDLHARLLPLGAVIDDEFDFPLTQEQIADLTGLTPVHVNRKLRELDATGLIVRKAKRLRIVDPIGLLAIAPIGTRQLRFEPPWVPIASNV
jgi:CRP/FNR family transcriptional regulator, anaerobic regulatory protein